MKDRTPNKNHFVQKSARIFAGSKTFGKLQDFKNLG